MQRLYDRFLSRQLDAFFVALKLWLQNRTCKPGAICRRDIAEVLNMLETWCNFAATKERIATLERGRGGAGYRQKRCFLKIRKDADKKRLFCSNVSTLLFLIVVCLTGCEYDHITSASEQRPIQTEPIAVSAALKGYSQLWDRADLDASFLTCISTRNQRYASRISRNQLQLIFTVFCFISNRLLRNLFLNVLLLIRSDIVLSYLVKK